VGTAADRPFAAALARAGARVTLLDGSLEGLPGPAAAGVAEIEACAGAAPTHRHGPLRALLVHERLARWRFDHVLVCGAAGVGHYACIARDLGLAHAGTGVWLVDVRLRVAELERGLSFPDGRTDIEIDFLERETVRRCDGVVVRDPAEATRMAAAGFEPTAILLWSDGEVGTLLSGLAEAPVRTPATSGPTPRVSVCMPTFNRVEPLVAAAESLFAQTSADFEVVLVEDGSTAAEARSVVRALEGPFAARGWTVLRQANAGPAAARRAARGAATGTHLLFMDDDNLALAHEVERFARAARSGADILTCIPGAHPMSDVGPRPVAWIDAGDPGGTRVGIDWTPVGACPALCVMVNCLGDNNALIRTQTYDALGGHAGDRTFVFEDFHLMSKAVARGFRLEVVPEPLFLYRRHAESRSMGRHIHTSHLLSLQPWLELVPRPLWPLLLHARRDWYDRHRGRVVADGVTQAPTPSAK
jgi:hypothetical protein